MLLKSRYDDFEPVNVPSRFEVCPRCEGKGQHDNPAFSDGITSEEWDRDWDDESRETYLRGGYDVKCEECYGLRVIEVPDPSRASFALRRVMVLRRREDRDHAEHEREVAHERRMGY